MVNHAVSGLQFMQFIVCSCSLPVHMVGIGNYMKNSSVIDGTIRLFFLVETFEQLRTSVTSIFNSICSIRTVYCAIPLFWPIL